MPYIKLVMLDGRDVTGYFGSIIPRVGDRIVVHKGPDDERIYIVTSLRLRIDATPGIQTILAAVNVYVEEGEQDGHSRPEHAERHGKHRDIQTRREPR